MSEETVATPQTPAEVDLLGLRALTTKTLAELIALASTVLVRDVAAATEAARHVDLAKAALKEAQAELERARTVAEGARTALGVFKAAEYLSTRPAYAARLRHVVEEGDRTDYPIKLRPTAADRAMAKAHPDLLLIHKEAGRPALTNCWVVPGKLAQPVVSFLVALGSDFGAAKAP
jgi:hypothetical protein